MARAQRTDPGFEDPVPARQVSLNKTDCAARAPPVASGVWRADALQCRRDRANRRRSMASNQRLAVGERFRDFGKSHYGCKQRVKIAKQVADKAVRHIAFQVRILRDKLSKAEGVVIKGV